MKIDLHTDAADTVAELHHFAGCCASFELGTFRNRIDLVQIRLSSVKAAHSGQSKNCVIQVELGDGERVVAEADDSNPYVAIHWALERAGWAISSSQQNEPGRVSQEQVADRQPVFEGEPGRAA